MLRFRRSDPIPGDSQASKTGIAVRAKNIVAGRLATRASAPSFSHNDAWVMPTYSTGAARYCIPVHSANSTRLFNCTRLGSEHCSLESWTGVFSRSLIGTLVTGFLLYRGSDTT